MLFNWRQKNSEDQFGGGWAVEGVRAVSRICVPRGTVRELERWCSLLGWEPEPCLSLCTVLGGEGGRNPRGQSRAFASTKPLPDVLQAETLCMASGALVPTLEQSMAILGREEQKSGLGGALSSSGQEACPTVPQEQVCPVMAKCPAGGGGRARAQPLPLCSSLGFRCCHRGFLLSLLPTLPNLSLPSALKINNLFITV